MPREVGTSGLIFNHLPANKRPRIKNRGYLAHPVFSNSESGRYSKIHSYLVDLNNHHKNWEVRQMAGEALEDPFGPLSYGVNDKTSILQHLHNKLADVDPKVLEQINLVNMHKYLNSLPEDERTINTSDTKALDKAAVGPTKLKAPGEVDSRPNEMLPEDFYGASRSEAVTRYYKTYSKAIKDR